ncbi:MAG: hypothetical protein WC028_28870 [Candidatus Obscuribacterales bacterium]
MPTIPHIQFHSVKNGYDNGGRVVFCSPYISRDIYFEDFALVEKPMRELGLTGDMPASFEALNKLESFINVDLDLFNDVMDKYQNGIPADEEAKE